LRVRVSLKSAYFKICNCFILICELSNFESIKFIEKQYAGVIKNSNNNILLIANIKQNVDQASLEYLNDFCEKNFLKPHFVNLVEYDNKTDRVFEKFINNSLVKKTGQKDRRSRKNSEIKYSNSVDAKDGISTAKKNDCIIF
jgi:hypothetical protein